MAALFSLAATVGSSLAYANGWSRGLGRSMGGARDGHYRPVHMQGRVVLTRRFNGTRTTSRGTTLTSHGTSVSYLHDAHYNDVRAMSLALLRRYNPDDHFFVGVGRSPVAIVTFLRLLNEHLAMTFPASDLRMGVQPQWKPEFFAHFSELIPREIVNSEKTIVLIDRSHPQSGTSLAQLGAFLGEWLESQGSRARVVSVGFAVQGPLTGGVQLMNTSGHPNVFLYNGTDHDESVAPFLNKHQIGVENIDRVQPNPQFRDFRRAMKERMRGDWELEDVLAREFRSRAEASTDAADDPDE